MVPHVVGATLGVCVYLGHWSDAEKLILPVRILLGALL